MKAPNNPFLIVAFVSLALVGCHGGGGASGGDVATVNGEAISMDEFHKYLERKPAVQVITQQGPAEMQVAAPLGFQAMRDLINRRILLEVAQDEKVMPTDADVKKELEFQTKQRPDFMQRLTAQGLTLEDIRRDLTLDLAKEKIITKGITVTPNDVDEFIKANPDKFTTHPEAKIRLIQVRDKASEKPVDAALAAGQPFGQVAVQFSTAQNVRQTQGVYPVTDVTQMSPALQALVQKTDAGKATDWIDENGQFFKVYIEQKVAAKRITIDDGIKETVRRQLAMERGAQASDLSKRLVAKLTQSKVNVNVPELKTLWDTAFKSLQEADVQAKTPTAGATGTPPATTAGK